MILSVSIIKDYLGITGTTSDSIISTQRDLVVGEINVVLNRRLELATYSNEVLEYKTSMNDLQFNPELDLGRKNRKLFLANFPVVSFISLVYDNQSISTNDYSVINNSGIIETYSVLPTAYRKLKATYVAGYNLSTIPHELQFLLLEGVRQLWGSFGSSVAKGSGDVESKKVGDYSVTYGGNSEGLYQQTSYVKRYLNENIHIINAFKNVSL